MGRPPIGKRAMTSAERVRRRREATKRANMKRRAAARRKARPVSRPGLE